MNTGTSDVETAERNDYVLSDADRARAVATIPVAAVDMLRMAIESRRGRK
jgi:hypothetical protein